MTNGYLLRKLQEHLLDYPDNQAQMLICGEDALTIGTLSPVLLCDYRVSLQKVRDNSGFETTEPHPQHPGYMQESSSNWDPYAKCGISRDCYGSDFARYSVGKPE